MPLKAVLFDMDGVIVDTEPLHRKAYFKMFDDLGIDVSPELYTTFTGASTKKVCQTLVDTFNLSEAPDTLAQIKRKYFKHYFDTDTEFNLIPDVKNLIQHYYDRNITLVLASSAHMNTINWVFTKFDLEKYFVGKISGADLKESKPHPEIFLLAAEMSGQPKENCLVIEDSTNGILASHAAGIFCVAYKSEHTVGQDYSKASLVISDFSEIEVEKIGRLF